MEILERKIPQYYFRDTFYNKTTLLNVHIWQNTVYFQIGACEEYVQILLHVNRIDLGDILNIYIKVASLNVEMKQWKMSKLLHMLLLQGHS